MSISASYENELNNLLDQSHASQLSLPKSPRLSQILISSAIHKIQNKKIEYINGEDTHAISDVKFKNIEIESILQEEQEFNLDIGVKITKIKQELE